MDSRSIRETVKFMSGALTIRDTGLSRREIMAVALPENYQAMAMAIKQCESVDECIEWTNRAEAIAAYFRMAKDKEPMHAAARLRIRAVRRLGELLNQEYRTYKGNKQQFREERVGDIPFAITAEKLARVQEGLFDVLVDAPKEKYPVHEEDIVPKHAVVLPEGHIRHKDGTLVTLSDTGTSASFSYDGIAKARQEMTTVQARDERLSRTLLDIRKIINRYDNFSLPLSKIEASRLLDGLTDLDEWIDKVKTIATSVMEAA